MLKRLVKKAIPQSLVTAHNERQLRRSLSPRAREAWERDALGFSSDDQPLDQCVAASLAWICRAQDCSTSADGGVARDFSLVRGWNASYPETTGYIVPTLLEVAAEDDRDDLRERARRMLRWLVSIQRSDGGFQGGTIGQVPVVSVTFNTGQILLGLAAGVRHFGDAYREPMHRAARFLRDSLDPEGAWRRHPTPFANPGDKAYETHAAWGLFEAARLAPECGYGEAGLRQVRWAISRQLPNGWFRDNDLGDPATPLTHTIGYVIRGILEAHRWRQDPELIASARRALDALLECIGDDGRIAGKLDRNWKPVVNWVCLTGSAQLAACWLLLAEATGDLRYERAAFLANRFVRRTVVLAGDPDLVGGVKGSFPIHGAYGAFEYLNWAAKFFIDAQRMEASRRKTGAGLAQRNVAGDTPRRT